MNSFVRYALQQSKTRLCSFAVPVGLSRSDTSFWSQAKVDHDRESRGKEGETRPGTESRADTCSMLNIESKSG